MDSAFLATVLAVIACALWLWRALSSRREVPKGAKTVPLLREPCTFFGGHIGWMREQMKKHGGMRFMGHFKSFMKYRQPIYTVKLGPSFPFRLGMLGQRLYFVHDSTIAEEIIKSKSFGLSGRFAQIITYIIGGPSVISLDGEVWKRHRRIMQPIFRREQLRSALEVINRHTSACLDQLLEEIPDSRHGAGASSSATTNDLATTVNAPAVLTRLSMNIIAEVAYGYNLPAQSEETQKAVRKALPETLNHFASVVLYPSLLLYKLLHWNEYQRFLRSRQLVKEELIFPILKRRRQTAASGEETPYDLLSLLLTAEDEIGEQGGLTDDEVVHEALTMFVAGYETMTGSLSWIFYYLCKC